LKPELNLHGQVEGPPFWLAWLLGGMFSAILIAGDVALSEGGVIDHAVYWGRDFVNVWSGGQLIRAGRVDILFDLPAYAQFQQSLFGGISPHNYSYPPSTYALASLMSLLPYPAALIAWLAGTGALFVVACQAWWPRAAGPVWLAVLTPAALMNIWAGHYGFLVGALFLLGWQRLEKHPLQAGVLFGLMLIKPHLAILVPLVLLVRGEWRAIAAAAATVLLIVASTSAAYGWQCWADFFVRTSAFQAGLIDPRGNFFGLMSPSVATALMELGSGWAVALTVQAIVAAAAVAMVVIATCRAAPVRDIALLAATATFLVLPYSFNYDMTVVMLGALTVITSAKASALDRRLGLYGFLAPQIGMITAAIMFSLMPAMLIGLAIAQFRLCCASSRRGASPTFNPDTALAA
jgi:alpha-1,2-mannosyltransferase